MDYQKGLVSIVIPVYNGEKYLSRCLDSVIAQTYSHIEIILVDDGSKDGSLNVCMNYASKDNRIYVETKENTGVSDTRNLGMSKAMGEFIVFIDCDDYVVSGYVEHLVTLMKEGIDLGICGWVKESEKGETKGRCVDMEETCGVDRCLEVLVSLGGVQGYPISKIFRTSLLRENGIVFDKDIAIFEDLLFCCEYTKKCRKISINTKYADYHYILHPTGSRYASVHAKEFNRIWITEVYSLEKLLSVVGDSKDARKRVRARIALSSSFYINRMFECNYEDKQLQKDLVSKIRKNLGPAMFSSEGDVKWTMQAFLCSISPGLEYKVKSKL
ncbi:glycosyltransferase family 2 protein [Butyrivibrio sp. AE2032]|uniref:glycosyltransferase family 2 protein n=1 Tax=Butyrivibrio sp. AE2032 TaxID=1458463 RepID=UPI000553AC21|nr:glycosyltransferase family 2 protein [Butyrivibrio sp. AE2032]